MEESYRIRVNACTPIVPRSMTVCWMEVERRCGIVFSGRHMSFALSADAKMDMPNKAGYEQSQRS